MENSCHSLFNSTYGQMYVITCVIYTFSTAKYYSWHRKSFDCVREFGLKVLVCGHKAVTGTSFDQSSFFIGKLKVTSTSWIGIQ